MDQNAGNCGGPFSSLRAVAHVSEDWALWTSGFAITKRMFLPECNGMTAWECRRTGWGVKQCGCQKLRAHLALSLSLSRPFFLFVFGVSVCVRACVRLTFCFTKV